LKLDEEKSKHTGLAQEIGCGSTLATWDSNTPNLEIGWRKVKTYWFSSGNWLWLSTSAEFLVAGNQVQERSASAERVLIDCCSLVFD
jgi:hypothetical protein